MTMLAIGMWYNIQDSITDPFLISFILFERIGKALLQVFSDLACKIFLLLLYLVKSSTGVKLEIPFTL